MSGKNFLFTLIGLAVAIFAILKLDFGDSTVENFGGLQLGRKAMPVAKFPNGRTSAVSGNYFDPNYGNDKFVKVPQFQSILSPRMSGGINYGANIRYNTPDYKNLAVPCDPLTFSHMANEGYTGDHSRENYGSCGLNCGQFGSDGYNLEQDPHVMTSNDSNYNQLYNQLRDEGTDVIDELPVGTMTTMDTSGNLEQSVIYDRLMFHPFRKSRLLSQGDKIRGDIPIVPDQIGWFSVYPNINVDLSAGAMGVLGGAEAVDKNLVNLITKSSGGVQNTIAGFNFEDVNMSTMTELGLDNGATDVVSSSFP